MTREREILTSILKLTREGPVNIELIAKDSKTPLSVVEKYIAESSKSGLVYFKGKLVDVKPIQRLKIALEAIKLGADLERVCRNLSWSEFEEIAIKAFQVNGYLTVKHFRFRHKNRNWEIDILATKGRIIVCVDCKRWNRRLTSSAALKVVNAQIERVRALAEALPKIKGKIKFPLKREIFLVPAILSLVPSSFKFYEKVPLVPILQLQTFLDELPAQIHSLAYLKVNFE